ncbi:hypothetical protein VTI74DRAFT_7098 [Chaetomium olivicolor]
MVTSLETRDLRSARKEWKRTKDSNSKWSHGVRPLSGVRFNINGEVTGTAQQQAGVRPCRRWRSTLSKPTPNLVKPHPRYDIPYARVRSELHCQAELRDFDTAATPLASPSLSHALSLSTAAVAAAPTSAGSTGDPFLYSFDRTDTPGGPLTLEVFVKKGKGRKGGETERLVEREYEVVDGDTGEAVRGRRARALLRREGSKETQEEPEGGGEQEGEDEGFELI